MNCNYWKFVWEQEDWNLGPAQTGLLVLFLADPGKARGCPTNSFVNSFSKSWFVKISLQRRYPLMVEDGAFSHKIYNCFQILNLEGHPNCISGSKVMAILLNQWIFPIGGVASGRICVWSLRSRPVKTLPSLKIFFYSHRNLFKKTGRTQKRLKAINVKPRISIISDSRT